MSLVGHHIGRYRILEQIGSGGMSVVYKGVDTALEREVAVKVLHPHLAGKEDSRKRLAREAQAVAKLQHPNILEVFDFAAGDSDTAYIVTEFIRGQTLRQCAEKHPFNPPEIAAMAIHEIAAALAHAHEAGIIHRDLKPENVMVRDDGVIKLMDFGIAKILDREDRMTMTGALVGSPAHMAPEIIEGREVGPEADVFSLGTMLYYFATGVLPFLGANATATLKKILDGTYEDPRKLTPAICDRLAEIIATCLARQPSGRYSSARQLQQALGEYLSSVGLSHPADELGWFFLDPPAYRERLVGRLVESQLRSAEPMLGSGELAKALSCLNQVLALDPGNQRASQLLARMNRTKRRRYLVRRGAAVGGFAAALTALAAGALSLHKRSARPDDGQTLAASAPATVSIANERSSARETATGESRSAPVPSGAAEGHGHALTSVKPSELLKGVAVNSREPAKPST
ncbi:MAG TPA: serine/threonine-protein kinase, partial [Myxococcaceae bacterium]|nr:serine/threonine-protein kinase [Myxococcaceae bacterium]